MNTQPSWLGNHWRQLHPRKVCVQTHFRRPTGWWLHSAQSPPPPSQPRLIYFYSIMTTVQPQTQKDCFNDVFVRQPSSRSCPRPHENDRSYLCLMLLGHRQVRTESEVPGHNPRRTQVTLQILDNVRTTPIKIVDGVRGRLQGQQPQTSWL